MECSMMTWLDEMSVGVISLLAGVHVVGSVNWSRPGPPAVGPLPVLPLPSILLSPQPV